ncbi:hypothetical protein PsYK624_058640 [Phanerochaete sordida]|uniref:Uncharacterized protein n=1 Tax=Phanerochaete sordida TaxID=48140 RepID=A0A9P3LCY3_9APHY|nr:hypothetical protein PsYK624_058640 [Phanerochaete sordida]
MQPARHVRVLLLHRRVAKLRLKTESEMTTGEALAGRRPCLPTLQRTRFPRLPLRRPRIPARLGLPEGPRIAAVPPCSAARRRPRPHGVSPASQYTSRSVLCAHPSQDTPPDAAPVNAHSYCTSVCLR